MAAPAATTAIGKIERAHQLYREGRHVEALGFYTEALAMAKTRAQKIALHSNRAACYLKLHDFRKAADECTAVLELDHQHTGALMLRAQTLVTLKEYQSALFDVNRLMELNPASEVYKNLQSKLRTQLSLAPIPESEEESFFHEDEQTRGDGHEKKVPANVLDNNIESPKIIIDTTVGSRNVKPENHHVRIKSVIKAVENGHGDVMNEKWEPVIAKENNTMQKKIFDKPADVCNENSDSAKGDKILHESTGKPVETEDTKNKFAGPKEPNIIQKEDNDKSNVQSKKNEFPMTKAAKNVPANNVVKSADAQSKKTESVGKEANTVQERNVDQSEDRLKKKNESTVLGANMVQKKNVDSLPVSQNRKNEAAAAWEPNMLQNKNTGNMVVAPNKSWETIPKPKGHSGLDYSRWDRVEDGSSDEDGNDEDEQPRYRFRVRNIGVRPVR